MSSYPSWSWGEADDLGLAIYISFPWLQNGRPVRHGRLPKQKIKFSAKLSRFIQRPHSKRLGKRSKESSGQSWKTGLEWWWIAWTIRDDNSKHFFHSGRSNSGNKSDDDAGPSHLDAVDQRVRGREQQRPSRDHDLDHSTKFKLQNKDHSLDIKSHGGRPEASFLLTKPNSGRNDLWETPVCTMTSYRLVPDKLQRKKVCLKLLASNLAFVLNECN